VVPAGSGFRPPRGSKPEGTAREGIRMPTAIIKPPSHGYQPIEDYAIIGDLATAALVGNNASIDFLCLPRFDSPSIFCANTDWRRGGRFQIAPQLPDAKQNKLYFPDTNVLLSRFLSEGGIAEVSDFMLVGDEPGPQALIRRAKTTHGEVSFRMLCQPRFNYARSPHRVEQSRENEILFVSEGEDGLALRLSSQVPMQVNGDGDAVATFKLRAGERATFVLEQAQSGQESLCAAPDFPVQAFKSTSNFWRRWVSRSRYNGRWRETVNRSALALKLLTSREYGSIIAAPCFGFPNEVGGERNWDYRFTWIRDASFTVYALMRLGYTDEARSFMHWLEQRIEKCEDGASLQIMYGIDGRPCVDELLLEHLEGYEGSRPVRIGSSNHGQKQWDIYGEVMDSIYLYDKHGEPISYDLWMMLTRLVDHVCRIWNTPDSGIWEVRSGAREFLYSRVMCWVAVDRACRMALKRSLPAPLDRWLPVRDRIYHSVFREMWNDERKAFAQFKGASAMDASALIMPLVKFIGPTDPRWLSTLRAIETDLVEDSLVYRYNVGEAFSDMLKGGEGTFSICSYWYIECVARSGDLRKARYLFEKMLGYGNEVGLFSEQVGHRGEFLGNVPQAFTHLALISAAFDLNRRLDRFGRRSA
jgi:GH15 family glucan-1,4-alpha-glucosidase